MKSNKALISLFTLVTVLFCAHAFAQGGWHRGGGHHGGGYGYNDSNYFDPSTVYSFSGTIQAQDGFCQQYGEGNRTGGGMSYLFTADDGSRYHLMTGPFWYLDQNGIELRSGQQIVVTASQIPPHNSYYQQYDYLVVVELTVNGRSLRLRNADGLPLWSGAGESYYYCPAFDTQQYGNWNGQVLSYRTRTNGPDNEIGSELLIRDQEGMTHRVFLSPQYYCEQIGFSARIGDQAMVYGYLSEEGSIVCQKLQLNDGQPFEMRDSEGSGKWAH